MRVQQGWKDACHRVTGKSFPSPPEVRVLYSDVGVTPEVLVCVSLTGVLFNQGEGRNTHTCHLRQSVERYTNKSYDATWFDIVNVVDCCFFYVIGRN